MMLMMARVDKVGGMIGEGHSSHRGLGHERARGGRKKYNCIYMQYYIYYRIYIYAMLECTHKSIRKTNVKVCQHNMV